MYLIDSNTFFRFRQRYVYIGHLSCLTLLIVVLFGIALKDSDRLERLHEIALRYVLMTFPTDMIDYVIRLVTH